MADAPPEWTGPFSTEEEAEEVRRRIAAEHAEYLDAHHNVMMELHHNGPDEWWAVALRGSPGWGPIEVDDD